MIAGIKMKIFIIGNPIASGGIAADKIKKLEDTLQKRGHHTETYLTRFAGDGKNKISNLPEGFDRIVVVGGDGTVNEIINGISDKVSPPILQLPTGNANLLQKDLKLPEKISKAVDLLENGKILNADIATMNGKRFIMVAGAGFDAQVTEELEKTRTGKVSNISYIKPALTVIQKNEKRLFTVKVDNNKTATGEIVLVCNIRNYAGICEIAWEADITSRCLDVVIIPRSNLLSLGKALAYAKFSRITKMPGVQYLKGKSIHIKADKPFPVQLDGDFAHHHAEVIIKLEPDTIPIIAP
jgi:diacylglycerol kinase (ATP)